MDYTADSPGDPIKFYSLDGPVDTTERQPTVSPCCKCDGSKLNGASGTAGPCNGCGGTGDNSTFIVKE